MTISKRIRSQLFISSSEESTTATTMITATPDAERMLIRLPLNRPLPSARKRPSRDKKCPGVAQNGLGWSSEEHERFLRGLEMYPTGPWKDVAAFVSTRTTRQVMTHAQKYRQKIARRQRGLKIPVRKPSPVVTPTLGPPSIESASEEKAMKSCAVITTTITTAPVHEQINNEKTGFTMELSATTTAAFGFSHSATTSPSSADHVMSDLSFYSVPAADFSARTPGSSSSYCSSFPPMAMTPDEFLLVTNELYAETLWMNQFGANDQINALLMPIDNHLEDPLAPMFQDPSISLSWPQQNKNLAMGIMYPPTHASTAHVLYECQL